LLAVGNAPRPRPLLSIVIVIYRIPRQAENTIFSLSTAHQRNVLEQDYEIVVVENRSSDMLGEERARRLGANVRYFERDEPGVSPAPAVNFGVSQARAPAVALMIDGARMATPRLVEHALLAQRIHPRPICVAPGYHLGPGMQHVTSREGYDQNVEQKLLASVDWKEDGYRLFEIGSFDEATRNGFLNPMLEATCVFCPRTCFDELGGMDERFDLPGGGEVNHDFFERASRLAGTRLVVLWGEGTFHQYHGGVSSAGAEEREARLDAFRRQYDTLRGRRFATYEREPLLLGVCSEPACKLLMEAARLGRLRYTMLRSAGRPEWPNG
jgi:glycosyltransferase involved in cell wall biosynthesis